MFSNSPSVMMNRRVSGFLDCSLTTFFNTFSRSSMSLCSYHRTVLLLIWMPFLTA
jgi:hypothetical protein